MSKAMAEVTIRLSGTVRPLNNNLANPLFWLCREHGPKSTVLRDAFGTIKSPPDTSFACLYNLPRGSLLSNPWRSKHGALCVQQHLRLAWGNSMAVWRAHTFLEAKPCLLLAFCTDTRSPGLGSDKAATSHTREGGVCQDELFLPEALC